MLRNPLIASRTTLAVTLAIVGAWAIDGGQSRACTSGGAMKAATTDGRPIIWQNMDWSDHRVVLRKHVGSGGQLDAIEIVKYGASIGWNALNAEGLGHVVNKLADFGGNGNLGQVFIAAQRTSKTIAEFETYLEGRGDQTVGENFLLMDKTGRVVDFEVGPSYFYPYDPEHAKRQQQATFNSPKLFVTRGNNPFSNVDQQEPDATVDSWSYLSSRFRYRTARDKFVERITNADRLTVEELMGIARWGNPGYDTHTISRPDKGKSGYSIWSTIMLGVKAGEDPKYATMLVALGLPDYSIFIPVWVDLAQAELCEKTTTWDASNIAWWSYKLFEDRFDPTAADAADYDNYINDLFKEVQDNIIDGVKRARRNWLDQGNTSRFHLEAKLLHDWSGWAAYRTVKSAYDTARADGKGCNLPPKIASLHPDKDGLTVTFRCDATDPDGDGIAEYFWNFGDGHTTGATQDATPSHTFGQPGTYLVACYARDGRASPAANVRFEYVTVVEHPAPDAGVADAGADQSAPADAGAADGAPADAGETDAPASALDGATADAGAVDAAADKGGSPSADAGSSLDPQRAADPPALAGGCSAVAGRSSGKSIVLLIALALLLLPLLVRRAPARATRPRSGGRRR